jgi:CRP/FNR family transcriptional regulator
MTLDKPGLLRRIPLFSGLDDPELTELSRLAIEKRYGPGDSLFQEGEECEGIFILSRGSVKIFKISPAGREMTIAVERAPGTVAELPLFDGGPYPASVTAIEDVVAMLIHKRDFRRFCLRFPEVALKVLAVVGKRLRHLVLSLENVTFGSVRQRLARYLLEQADLAGDSIFMLPLTHQELASRLGTVREVVSRNLARFQADGLIEVNGRQIRLPDRGGLEQEAELEI